MDDENELYVITAASKSKFYESPSKDASQQTIPMINIFLKNQKIKK